jgi:ACS family 4-hydroxyphenylacetate permease-like MFS transporter
MGMNGALGLAGWQWLFLLEALPSLILGVATYYFLTDRPADAKWLTQAERTTLERALAREGTAGATKEKESRSVFVRLSNPTVILLTLAYFCIVTSLNTNATWAPQIIKTFATNASLANIGWLAAIAPFFTVIAMPLWSGRSDRKGERTLHTMIPMAVASAGWMTVSLASSGWLRIFGLVLVSAGAFTAMAVFWALSAPLISQENRAAGVALISAGGTLGSALTPLIVGKLKDLTGGFDPGLWYAAILLLIGIGLLALVPKRSPA